MMQNSTHGLNIQSGMIRSGCGYTLHQDIFNDGTAGTLCLMSLRIRFVNGGG